MRLLKQAAIVAALFFAVPIAIVTVVPATAFAQDLAAGVVAPTDATFVQQLVLATMPIIGLVITALISVGLAFLKAKTGIDIEARHRDALQSALMNGVLFALQKLGWAPGQPVPPDLLQIARGYVESSVPDALEKFGINPRVPNGKAELDRLLTPKLPLADGSFGHAK